MHLKSNGSAHQAKPSRIEKELIPAALDDPANPPTSGNEHRQHPRYRYRPSTGLTLLLRHPGGTASRCTVTPQDLSQSGIGLLHTAFVHAGTRCIVSVPCLEGEPRLVAGVVVRCAHLRGQLHEIGVVFDSLIDLGQHIDPNQARVILGEATEWPRFSGKVLYVDASVDACELARFLLAKLGLGLHAATSLAEGLGLLSGNEFRLVAVGIEGTGLDEMAPAGTLRERGYDGPIVACIQVDTPEARKEALAAGFTAVIAKPFDFKSWSNVVRERLSGHFAS